MVTDAAPVDAAPHDARLSSPVPSDWLSIGVVKCLRCTASIPNGVLNPNQPVILNYIDVRTQQAHEDAHDINDARLRGETLTTPIRMTIASNQQAGIKQDGSPAKTGWRPNA